MHKFRLAWLALGCLWAVTVVFVSLMPHPPEPVQFDNVDKLEHALAYACLMLWFCQIYRKAEQRLMVGVLFAGMGIGLEYLQRMTGYRTFDHADMLANGTGVLLGWLLALTPLGRLHARLENRFITK